MAEAATTPCAGCQRLQEQAEALTLQLQQVQATVAHLLEQLATARKSSSTSSKLPPPGAGRVRVPGRADGRVHPGRPGLGVGSGARPAADPGSPGKGAAAGP